MPEAFMLFAVSFFNVTVILFICGCVFVLPMSASREVLSETMAFRNVSGAAPAAY